MENEIWKDIEGFEGKYQISNYGRVKSLARYRNGRYNSAVFVDEKIIVPKKTNRGYLQIGLCTGKHQHYHFVYIHRAVAKAFPEICGEWFKGAVCNHKDEDKTNNRADNLEWITQKENINYGTRNQRVSAKLRSNMNLNPDP